MMPIYAYPLDTDRSILDESMCLIYLQGFFGVFPWNVITYWFFRYLEKERGYSGGEVLSTMIVAILVLAAGYPLAGALGERLFRRTTRGRLIVSIVGVIAGTALFFITMNVPVTAKTTFLVMLAALALFTPFASPNVVSTICDVTLPEVRIASVTIESFVESVGAALSPLIAGLIAVICTSTWAVCALLLVGVIFLVPRDIEAIRAELRLRAQTEQTPVLDPGGLGLCGRRIRMWRQDCWQLARHDKGCLLEQSGQAFRLQVEADDDQQSRFTVTSRRRDRLDSLVVARPVVLEANGAKECHVLEAVRKGVDACGLGFGGGNGEHEEGSRWIEPDGTLSFHVDDGHGVQGACPSVGSRKRISVHRHQVCGRA